MYLKNARLSLGGDNKLMVVLEDGLASDYFKGEAHEQNKQQLEALFGPRVAALVMAETEDKTKSWKERKAATLDHLDTAPRESKILILGDKLSNLRCTARDYMVFGEAIWDRFNEKRKSEHAWYYNGVAERIRELAGYPLCQEYFELCRKVFGS